MGVHCVAIYHTVYGDMVRVQVRVQGAGVGCMVRYRVRWVHGCALCSDLPFSIMGCMVRVQGAGAGVGCAFEV